MIAWFDQSSGQPRVNPGKQGRGGRETNQKICEFSFRGILQPTTEQFDHVFWLRSIQALTTDNNE